MKKVCELRDPGMSWSCQSLAGVLRSCTPVPLQTTQTTGHGGRQTAPMDTPQLPTAAMFCLCTFQRCRVVLALMFILLSAACASQKAKVPEPESLQLFPEVRQITFMGNTHFSSGTLRQLMATQQRPLLPPWRRGEPYNPPTLDADLLRLKKFYFDHGFLECTVHVEGVQEDAEQRTVRIVIALD